MLFDHFGFWRSCLCSVRLFTFARKQCKLPALHFFFILPVSIVLSHVQEGEVNFAYVATRLGNLIPVSLSTASLCRWEQDKLLELDGLDEEQDQAWRNLKESITTVCKRRNHKSNYRRFTVVFHLSSFVEDSENTEPCRLYGIGKTVTIFFLALCRYTADCPAEVTHALTFWIAN